MVDGYFASDDIFAATRSVDLNFAFVDRQGMAERNEIMSAFRGHDARNNGGVEDPGVLRSLVAFAQGPGDGLRKTPPRLLGGYAGGKILSVHVPPHGANL